MTRAARVAALAAALLASSFPAADARTAAAPGDGIVRGDALALVAQDPWTPLGGDLTLGLHVSDAVADAPGATVRIVAAQALRSRADFDRVITEGVDGPSLDEVELPVSGLAADANGTRAVVLGLESPQARDASRFALRRAGVYPLVVEVVVPGRDLPPSASFTTFAVVTEATADGQPRQLASRLGVAWIWPFQAPPSMLPDGSRDPAIVESFGPTGRLGIQAAALARAGDVRLTLAPGPETLEAWVARGRQDATAAQGSAALLDAATRDEVLSSPYVPTDIASLQRAGLDDLVGTQLARGQEVLTTLLGVPPDPSIALATGPTDGSLTRLRAAGVTRVVVDRAALALEPSDATTLARPFELRTSDPDGPLEAVASDSGLVALLGGVGAPALRAQRVLAGLSIVAQEAPSDPRGVVLAGRPDLAAPAPLFDALLTGLRGNPWLESMTVAEMFDRIPFESGRSSAVRSVAPAPVPDPPVPADAYRLTRARLGAFSTVVGSQDPIVTEGTQALLIVESSSFSDPEGVARARETLTHVNNRMDGFLSGIRVPDPGTITLTSRAGEIPLTFRNDTGRRVRITVTLAAPKLFFPDGATYTVNLSPRSTTVPVAVEARTPGTFPLRLTVRTADGGLLIAETQLQVRSTAVSAVGLTLMIGAAVFLALWWGFHIVRARRRRESAARDA